MHVVYELKCNSSITTRRNNSKVIYYCCGFMSAELKYIYIYIYIYIYQLSNSLLEW